MQGPPRAASKSDRIVTRRPVGFNPGEHLLGAPGQSWVDVVADQIKEPFGGAQRLRTLLDCHWPVPGHL